MSSTIRQIIEATETRLEAAPDLGIKRSDPLTGPATMAQQRGAKGFYVYRERSVNLQETRNQDTIRTEDTIVVSVQCRVKPKAQTTSRGELYDIEQAVINRLTDPSWERSWTVVYNETEEEVEPGEWMRVDVRFSYKRHQQVGAG
jgi:hypothetical protein